LLELADEEALPGAGRATKCPARGVASSSALPSRLGRAAGSAWERVEAPAWLRGVLVRAAVHEEEKDGGAS
jgi:hypothetical protein